MKNIKISKSIIGINKPTYFIADIAAANHDGEINKAIDLIYSCAEAGANAAKFQHFAAETIVSDRGFRELNSKYLSHPKEVAEECFEVYKEASINIDWTEKLKEACEKLKLIF